MSAYIVSDYHINAIVTWAVFNDVAVWQPRRRCWMQIDLSTAQHFAATLYSENVRSVNARYGERTKRTGFTYKPVPINHLTAADIIKACDCLDYQSCETETWRNTEAHRILERIKAVAICKLIAKCQTWELREPMREAA